MAHSARKRVACPSWYLQTASKRTFQSSKLAPIVETMMHLTSITFIVVIIMTSCHKQVLGSQLTSASHSHHQTMSMGQPDEDQANAANLFGRSRDSHHGSYKQGIRTTRQAFDESSLPTAGNHQPQPQPHETEEEATAGAGEARATPETAPPDPHTLAAGAASGSASELLTSTNQLPPAHTGDSSKLRIVHLIAPEAVQNGTQNVTIDCMFKFDKKLDQRLTIKWFYNDELEPIYQWIPELNKRVYSDRYERYLDKSYEVSEDVDYMLQAYKWLQRQQASSISPSSSASLLSSNRLLQDQDGGGGNGPAEDPADEQRETSRRLLAGRLSKLAKLGGRQSRQLIDSLRSVLQMDQLEFSRYRALRLVRPTTELGGRFTCSVTSLDGEDFRTTKLVVYEPARNLSFNVSRTATGQQYNITCQAQAFPRPSLQLYRFRARALESPSASSLSGHSLVRPVSSAIRRPKLAATLLRESLASNGQVSLLAPPPKWSQRIDGAPDTSDKSSSDIRSSAVMPEAMLAHDSGAGHMDQVGQPLYEIISWALIDESSLSSNVMSQFECLLTIEGTDYEQRQSLALQRGWHVNSATTLDSRYALASVLALLCLLLAFVSSMLIFKLLRRHAKNRRVHILESSKGAGQGNRLARDSDGAAARYPANLHNTETSSKISTTQTSCSPESMVDVKSQMPPVESIKQLNKRVDDDESEADGVYRVPASETKFGTRYFVEQPGSRLYYGQPADGALSVAPGAYKLPGLGQAPQSGDSRSSSFGVALHKNNSKLQPPHAPYSSVSAISHHEYISDPNKPLYC